MTEIIRPPMYPEFWNKFTEFEKAALQPWLERQFVIWQYSHTETFNVVLERHLHLYLHEKLLEQEIDAAMLAWVRQSPEFTSEIPRVGIQTLYQVCFGERFYLRFGATGELLEATPSKTNLISYPRSVLHELMYLGKASHRYPELEPGDINYYTYRDSDLESKVRQTYLKRDRSGVGKVVSDCHYLHQLYEYCLPVELHAAKMVLGEFNYHLVKHNRETGAFTFIHCPNFDEAEEPWLGDSIRVTAAGDRIVQPAKTNTQIYHHKWLMVADDYPGFNVLESKRRSMYWLTLRGIDKSRIGYLSYWESEVVPRLEERMAADREKVLGASGLNPKKVPTPKNVALSSATVQQMSIF